MGRVEFVQDENDELTMRDDVFQLGELVDRYQVALSNDIEENSNFCITDNIFVDVDAEEVNDVLSFMLCVEINMFYCCDVN
jgi:hypothetical protein